MLSRPGTLRLVHHHPGRLRVRADAFLDDGPAIAAVRAALTPISAVQRVAHSGETGSILIEYEPGAMEPDEIVSIAAEAAQLDRIQDETTAQADPEDPIRHVVRGARTINALVAEATGGRADLRMLVPSGLFAFGIYSLARRPRLPRWENLLVWSYQFFTQMNQRHLRAEVPER